MSASDGDDAATVNDDSVDDCGKGKIQKMRQSIMKGRRWRHKAANHKSVFDKDGKCVWGTLVGVRVRCTLKKICKFNKMLEPHHREVIERTMSKSILEYRPFSIQRDLTTALVKAWDPWRKVFKLAGRTIPK